MLSVIMLSVIMLSVSAECHNAEYHNTDSPHAELNIKIIMLNVTWPVCYYA